MFSFARYKTVSTVVVQVRRRDTVAQARWQWNAPGAQQSVTGSRSETRGRQLRHGFQSVLLVRQRGERESLEGRKGARRDAGRRGRQEVRAKLALDSAGRRDDDKSQVSRIFSSKYAATRIMHIYANV